MANMAVSRIKREFKEVLRWEFNWVRSAIVEVMSGIRIFLLSTKFVLIKIFPEKYLKTRSSAVLPSEFHAKLLSIDLPSVIFRSGGGASSSCNLATDVLNDKSKFMPMLSVYVLEAKKLLNAPSNWNW